MRTDFAAQLAETRKELTSDIKGVSAEVSVLRTDVFQKIDVMRSEIFAVRSSIAAATVWMLTLQLTIAAGLLGVMAHGFKWI